MNPNIVIFQNHDLRLNDHWNLWEACSVDLPLILIFWHHDTLNNPWPLGSASKLWLHESLKDFQTILKKQKQKLWFFHGNAVQFSHCIIKLKPHHVYINQKTEPFEKQQIKIFIKKLTPLVSITVSNAHLILDPIELLTQQKKPYRVYTAFYNQFIQIKNPQKPIPQPQLKPLGHIPRNCLLFFKNLDELKLYPNHHWALSILNQWVIRMNEPDHLLNHFIDQKIYQYAQDRDFPAIQGTSRLSPYLRFGQISPRTLWYQLSQINDHTPYLKQLIWREFCYYLLEHFPQITDHPLRTQFIAFPWDQNSKHFHVWTQGLTGYPIVDAGMKELWNTGWMHNRVRMIVASFLTKDLFIHWQKGAHWFWDCLVDADLANNSCGWQWVAGCGTDAAPYFRIFNPNRQSEIFDQEATYIKKWIPQLLSDTAKKIHSLKVNYIPPLVDHSKARKLALEKYDQIKAKQK